MSEAHIIQLEYLPDNLAVQEAYSIRLVLAHAMLLNRCYMDILGDKKASNSWGEIAGQAIRQAHRAFPTVEATWLVESARRAAIKTLNQLKENEK
jgi:hypothetical protein